MPSINGMPIRATGTQREAIGMLIHELSIAVQRDRERAMLAALTTRRQLTHGCLAAPRGLVARLRGMVAPPVAAPASRAGSRHASCADPTSV